LPACRVGPVEKIAKFARMLIRAAVMAALAGAMMALLAPT
jgi:hypothetical protein